ncbi:protein ALP1-like isoform X2 [Prosopis cineraria]|uniref:protein ALP1-like isoform X2 n=1 Tax=Prosopis cineraria TaxID=364024 RepID=UPI00241026FA|nr:protein ALP1-like isoform X2 [Prosopis cineraria]XP_054806121.1 protein ALP1-like isoform X2 [Prosopis cineraria]
MAHSAQQPPGTATGGGGGGHSNGNNFTRRTATKRKAKKCHPLYPLDPHKLVATISSVTSSSFSFLRQSDVVLLPSQTLLLESILSSTSLSLSRLLSLLPKPSDPLSLTPNPPLLPQTQCWFHRFLSATSSDDSLWLDAFHMSKPCFTHLLNLLSPSLGSAIPKISPIYALAASLFRLAHGASYKAVARRFGVESAVACRAFYVVCKAINEDLGHLFELRSDTERIVVGFGWRSLPNCCGLLGLARFGIDGELLGKNGCLMLQALVDYEGRFLDVSAGWPSTMKPESILRQSKLYLGVEESRELLQGPSYKLSDGCLIPPYILGDSCFPLLPWLLTPYNRLNEEDSFSSVERAFNSAHNQAMGSVGSAFRRLRARWQLLSKQWKEDCIEYLPFVIVTGCLLHNFLIKCRESVAEEFVEHVNEEDVPVFEGVVDEGAQRIRDALALHMSRVSIER